MAHENIVIVSAQRTPIGSFMGVLSSLPATQLGATAIASTLAKTGIDKQLIDEVIMGCVLPAGLGQAPARQAALNAGLDQHTCATTLNKVCGSGMKAVMLAYDALLLGNSNVVIAGGMESMSNAPYLLAKARKGYRIAHDKIYDHMMLDGLENAYDGKAMGCFAQERADTEALTREEMDTFALASLAKAIDAQTNNYFSKEIAPININEKIVVSSDEGPQRAKPEKIPQLKPAFSENGTITAANSSSISDGAAALLLMKESLAQQLQLTPLAKVVGHSTHAMAPKDFTVAPINAIEKLLKSISWPKESIDLFEINEAFAMVTMLTVKKLGLDESRVNVSGGACALGHPIGASGARIIVTLVHALRRLGLRRGVASLCIGGGEATALAVELYS